MKKYISYKLALSIGLLNLNTLSSCVNARKDSIWPSLVKTRRESNSCSLLTKITACSLGAVAAWPLVGGLDNINTNPVTEQTLKPIDERTNSYTYRGNKIKPMVIDEIINDRIAKLKSLKLDKLQELEYKLNEKRSGNYKLTLARHLIELEDMIKNAFQQLSTAVSLRLERLQGLIEEMSQTKDEINELYTKLVQEKSKKAHSEL